MAGSPLTSHVVTRTSLAELLYRDEDVYQRDVRWLRESAWLLAGHESQVPGGGDYFLYEFDSDSVIVIRDESGEVRSHHNVCRHRGSRICTSATGSVRALTCPYHAWSYELNGKLRGAPSAPRNFNKTPYTLRTCHVRLHCGLIFLSFASTPPDFMEYISAFTRELEMQQVKQTKVVRRQVLCADANWKLLVENNLECYHCRPAHPTYTAAHPAASLGGADEYIDAARYETLRSASCIEQERRFAPLYRGFDATHFQLLSRYVIGEGCSTESVRGRSVAPLMGRCAYEGVQTVAIPSPLTSIYLNPDYVVIYTFVPRSRRRTDIQVVWLVKESAVEGVDFVTSDVTAVWEPTLREDKALAENTQLGIDSSAYSPGPYMEAERFVADFDAWYLKHMGTTL